MPNFSKPRLSLTPRWTIAILGITNLLRDPRVPESTKDRVATELEKLAEAADLYNHTTRPKRVYRRKGGKS